MQAKIKLLVLTALLIPALAMAGYVQPQPVEIDLDNSFASGDMHTARNGENDDEFIGCGLRYYDFGGGNTFVNGFCQAQVEELAIVNCFTESPILLDAISSLDDGSYIQFSWSDDGEDNLTCQHVGSSTQSFYLEKGKINKAADEDDGT